MIFFRPSLVQKTYLTYRINSTSQPFPNRLATQVSFFNFLWSTGGLLSLFSHFFQPSLVVLRQCLDKFHIEKVYWDPLISSSFTLTENQDDVGCNRRKFRVFTAQFHKSFWSYKWIFQSWTVACVPTGQRNWIKCLKQLRWTACDVFPVLFTTKLFSFPPGYRKDNWLKVQRQSRNGSRKGSTEGNQIHKSRKVQVENSGASSNQEVKSTGRTVLCYLRAAKMQERRQASGVVEIGRVEGTSHSIFEKFCQFYMRKWTFFIIRYLIINFNTLF